MFCLSNLYGHLEEFLTAAILDSYRLCWDNNSNELIPFPSHKEIKAESLRLEKPPKITESTINPSVPGPCP